jgi:hypothetical protein
MKNGGPSREPIPKGDKDLRAKWLRSLGYFSIIVGDLVGFSGAGVGLGYWLWKEHQMPWWIVLICSIAGLSISMYRLFRLTQRDVDIGG